MKLRSHPELLSFFSAFLFDAEAEPAAEERAVRAFADASPASRLQQALAQARALAADPEPPIDELGSEANRWFGDSDEARAWLSGLAALLQAASSGGGATDDGAVVVKDSNGTPLAEGDSVTVIKDLEVKGGSSDLKRGTLVKKIHLIGDPDNIECRVNGSTLVLKTKFLKKA